MTKTLEIAIDEALAERMKLLAAAEGKGLQAFLTENVTKLARGDASLSSAVARLQDKRVLADMRLGWAPVRDFHDAA